MCTKIRRREFIIRACTVAFVLSIWLGVSQCREDTTSGNNHGGSRSSFLFAVISDTHIVADENEPQDQIFSYTVQVLNDHTPPIDFVVCTGDLVESLPSDNPNYYKEHSNTELDQFIHLAADLTMPLYAVMGNHDYYTIGLLPIPTRQTEAREQLYVDKGVMPGPYYAFEHLGVKFYCLNSMQQDPAVRWGPNAVGTLGPEQIAWLREQLSDDTPAFFFHHHALATVVTTHAGISSLIPFEIPRADGYFSKYQWSLYRDYTDPIYEILTSHHTQIRAAFFGHSHLFLRDEYEGIPIFMTDSMKPPSSSEYDGKPMRYHIVECQANTGDFTIYNEYMIPYFNGYVLQEDDAM